MIHAHIIGGLGNQMFQYAAAKSLALRHNTKLILDTSDFESYEIHHGFQLNSVFNIESEVSLEKKESKRSPLKKYEKYSRILNKMGLLKFVNPYIVYEPHFHYWRKWDKLPNGSHLKGYWQSDKYFSYYRNQILKEFTFKQELNEESQLICSQINNSNSISIHVRRGDYLSNEKNISIYGTCSTDYYNISIKNFLKKTKKSFFFIFSDDPIWVEKNLDLRGLQYKLVSHNTGLNNWQDMYLMSICQHNIIANSTFSWWAAWLNQNPSKTIISPTPWFNNKGFCDKDLIPKSWKRVEKQ